MSTQFAVDLVFKSQGLDKLSKAKATLKGVGDSAKNAQNNVRKFGTATKTAAIGTKLLGPASKIAAGGVGALGVAVNATLGPLLPLIAGVAGLTAAFKTLKDQDFAEAKFETLGGNAEELKARLQEVSRELNGQASVVELTGAAYDVASAGFGSAAEAAQVLKAASLGATGGFAELNTVANATTSVLNAYGLAASDATALVDGFIQTQNDGKIVVSEYADNIGKVASAAAGLKIPMEEVNAVIAQSTASGVKAEVAFTGLKSAMARFASGEAAKALKDVGISINAASLEADGLLGTFRKMQKAGLDTGQIFKALGTEAAPALLPVLNNLEKFEQLLNNQKNSAGAAALAQATAAATIEGAWKKVTTALQNLFAEQSGAGEAIRITLEGAAFAIDAFGKGLTILLAPIKLVWSYMVDLGAAIEKTFSISEGIARFQAWLRSLANNPVFKFMAKHLGSVAQRMGLASKSAEDLAGAQGDVDVAAKSTAASVGRIPPQLEAAKGAQKQLTASMKEADAVAKTKLSTLDQELQLNSARLNAEKAINGVLLQQAQRRLAGAKNAGEQIAAARAIYDLTIKQAELEYAATLQAIDGMVKKAALAKEAAQVKLQEVQAAKALAAAQGQSTAAYAQALAAQQQVVASTLQMLKTTQAVAVEQKKGAAAVLEGAKAAAQAAFEQNKVFQATSGAADEAQRFATNMQAGAAAAEKAASATSSISAGGGSSGGSSFQITEAALWNVKQANTRGIAEFLEAKERIEGVLQEASMNTKRIQRQMELDQQATEYAAAGFGEAAALVRNYADSFVYDSRTLRAQSQQSSNTAAGALGSYRGANSGSFNPQVNITTGPVTQMGGTNYVTTSDLQSATSSAAQQGAQMALQQLQNNPGVRRQVGIG